MHTLACSRSIRLLLALWFALAGCGGGDENRAEPLAEGPAYLVGTRVWDDASTTSYFHVVPSIEAGGAIDSSQALEVAGAAKLFAIDGVGWFAIGGAETPTITRYSLDASGALIPVITIDLQEYGVAGLWNTLYVVSPTKAYYPDREGAQLIVWNPTSMEITGSIDLSETVRDGYLSLYGYAPIVRGKALLVSVGWFDWNETDSVLGETGLVTIDTETDSVLDFVTDDRCGGVSQPITLSSGDTLLASSALAGVAHRLGRASTKPCALRVAAHELEIDAGYYRELETLTGSTIAGEPVPAGGDAIFLRVLDAALASIGDDNATWEVTAQSAWRWARWDAATDEVVEVPELAPSTSDVLWFEVDGRVFGTETTASYSETTLIDLGAEGGPRRELTAPGFLHGVARIR